MEIDIKKNYKFWLILIMVIIAIFLMAFYRIKISNMEYIASYDPTVNSAKYDKSYEAKNVGDEIGQTFEAKYNKLSRIYVKFEQLKIENSYLLTGGTAIIGLKDIEGNDIYTKELNVKDLRTNSGYIFEFPIIEDSQGKNYYIYVKCKELEQGSEFHKVQYSEENLYEYGDMYINGEKQLGDMLFQEMYYDNTKIKTLAIFMIMITLILLLISIIIYYHKNITAEKLFWFIIPVTFILFLLIMPMFKGHDEAYHWFRAYDIAQGNYLTEIVNDIPCAKFKQEIIEITKMKPEDINYNYIKQQITKNTINENEDATDLSTTSIYNPIQYVPQTMRNIANQFIY